MGRIVRVDCGAIADWPSFHEAFVKAFGFPGFYGRNLDAWIDCMTRLDEEFSDVRVRPGEAVTLQLDGAASLKERRPEILAEILELSAFVNWRRIETGEPSILCVAARA